MAHHDLDAQRAADDLIGRLQADLLAARKKPDPRPIAALRTALAAIANAEAPPADATPNLVIGRLVDHQRLVLTAADIERVIRHEITDRREAIDELSGHGQASAVADLRAEIAVLEPYLV